MPQLEEPYIRRTRIGIPFVSVPSFAQALRLSKQSRCHAGARNAQSQSANEQPTITATSRFVTGQKRGKCHRRTASAYDVCRKQCRNGRDASPRRPFLSGIYIQHCKGNDVYKSLLSNQFYSIPIPPRTPQRGVPTSCDLEWVGQKHMRPLGNFHSQSLAYRICQLRNVNWERMALRPFLSN